jgi:hypothetical protein
MEVWAKKYQSGPNGNPNGTQGNCTVIYPGFGSYLAFVLNGTP